MNFYIFSFEYILQLTDIRLPDAAFVLYRLGSGKSGSLTGYYCRRNNSQNVPAVSVSRSCSAGGYYTVEAGFTSTP